jgi:hypothetical protein
MDGANDSVASSLPSNMASMGSALERIRKVTVVADWKFYPGKCL